VSHDGRWFGRAAMMLPLLGAGVLLAIALVLLARYRGRRISLGSVTPAHRARLEDDDTRRPRE